MRSNQVKNCRMFFLYMAMLTCLMPILSHADDQKLVPRLPDSNEVQTATGKAPQENSSAATEIGECAVNKNDRSLVHESSGLSTRETYSEQLSEIPPDASAMARHEIAPDRLPLAAVPASESGALTDSNECDHPDSSPGIATHRMGANTRRRSPHPTKAKANPVSRASRLTGHGIRMR